MTSPFIGREAQLASLRRFSEDPRGARMTALYGRRRIGKTRLVREAYQGFRLLQFEGLEGVSSREQRRHFMKTLHRYSGSVAHRLRGDADWEDLLILLAEYVAGEPTVVFFDEFQWMAAGRGELVSKLKFVWDNYFTARGPIHLVLCGSISSFLVRKVVRSKALYGRIDEIIDLGPLDFASAREGFFASRSSREALELYLAFGGVPKYLELIDPRRSARRNIADLCFRPGAYFVDEFDRLFVSHFGKKQIYRSIVEHLAGRGFASRAQITRHLKMRSGGSLSAYLEDLSLAGFIETYAPVHSLGSTRLKRYRIADPFLRFYFRFIRPLRDRVAQGEAPALHHALPDKRYDVYLGLAFEGFCQRHAHRVAAALGFSAVAYDCGSWFRREDLETGAQIDLLFKRADHVWTLCEIKFREHVGPKLIPEIERKVAALSRFTHDTIEKVLITAHEPTQALVDEGGFSRILTLDDL
jgi:uncharacterized protein